MIKENNFLPWSDNWRIDGDQGWFIDGESNILYCADWVKGELIFRRKIPESESDSYRLNPCCIKCKDSILCMPDRGNSIWVYRLQYSQFQHINIRNTNGVRIFIRDFWQLDERIYAVSNGLKQLIEIDMDNVKVDHYYDLYNIPDTVIAKNIMVGTVIYSVGMEKNEVYLYDIKTKSSSRHIIKNVESGFRTICFDGKNFWLSGCRKEIYVWNGKKDTVGVLDNFPDGFGIYNMQDDEKDFLNCKAVAYDFPVFAYSVVLGQYVWFIPVFANKIIYVDKDSFEMYEFEIGEEGENRESLMSRKLKFKFIMEYVRQKRYIGIFSAKNNCIFEIDSMKMKYEKRNFDIGNIFIEAMKSEGNKSNGLILSEFHRIDQIIFKGLINTDIRAETSLKEISVGNSIYRNINQ